MTVTQINEGLSVLPGDVNVPSKIKFQKPLENVFHKVRSYHGREVPVEFRQKQEFPFLNQENKLDLAGPEES